ncbi:hypothetical protein PMZ80_007977 [Knufia obscura]|uniref:2,5-diamino-6-ribosylamino-4(3H)-pyrimidinone 5'-phosphate reductase n=1 Tax=Knufia obscura TaxID=1635080 RepID=A0ABR0RG51_9EURO|nr:hypothetical protein PMZ80_007977 [Knufia obscura]
MTSLPQTPSQREAVQDLEESRLGEHSDDDSDINHDGERPATSPDPLTKQEKAQDQEGAYTEEVNTGYSLFSNPPGLARTRQQLFDIRDEFELSAKDFEEYFPFVDNVWRKQKAGENQADTEGATEIFCCRLKPSGQSKNSTPKAPVEGKQQRRKRKREEKTCGMLMKVTYVENPVKKVKIAKAAGSEDTHSHDLDYMDANKRNTAIMDVARREANRGFLPGSIYWKMQEEPVQMEEAGGKFMKVSDVRNVQYPWRQQNMTVTLKAHAGYSQQRSGPRQRLAGSTPGSTPGTPKNGEARPQKPAQTFSPHPPQSSTKAPPAPPPLPPGTLNYPELAKEFLRPYLPYIPQIASQQRPHITLTWATSLDSRIALLPGVQTAISGPETKAMTHYLRSQHDAILIGVNTALSDDPGLNCRLAGAGGFGGKDRAMQPRPIIVDPHARLQINPNMRLLRAASEGKALGPWIVVGPGIQLQPHAVQTLKAHGGEFLQINEIHPEHGLDWEALFSIFHREGVKSIMIEGGGKVLSELLKPRYTSCIDTVVITIAPTFFGKNGVQVSPDTSYEGGQAIQTRLADVKWQPMGQSDMVLCAHLDKRRFQQPLPGIQEFSRQAPPQTPYQRPAPPQGQSPMPPPPQSQQHGTGQPPPPHVNGNGTPAPAGPSPKFRHYGPPGPSRQ